jgi:hypothetical protein
MMGRALAVGASVGVHTGNVDRTITREFVDSTFAGGNFTNRSRWDYNGPTAAVGVRWDASVLLRVGASLTWSGTLKANPKQGSTESYEYDMPLRMALGASAQLSSKWMATASVLHSRYGSGSYSMPGTDQPTVADNTTDIGAGLEWQGLRTSSRVFPIRAGFRHSGLPFHATGDEAGKEWAVSGGLGLRLVEDDYGPLAVADLAFEKGNRSGWSGGLSADGLSEDFWRATVTVSLFGR